VLFFLPVLYFSIKKPLRLLLILFLFVLFLIKGAPEEKFHLYIYFFIGYFSKKTFKNYGIIYVTGIALIDEIIQYFLPQRYFDFKDIALNAGGGIAGFLF
jgi:VanZ family protein